MFEHAAYCTIAPAIRTTAAFGGGLILALALAGCAGESPIVDYMLVVPDYYDTLPCNELVGHLRGAENRVKELTVLMAKSSGNAAGPAVNAMAYNTDFAKARATQKYAGEAAHRKGCDLTKKVEQKPVDTAPPLPGRPVGYPGMSGAPGTYGMGIPGQ